MNIFQRIGTLINQLLYTRQEPEGGATQRPALQFVAEQLERPGLAGNTLAENVAGMNASATETVNLLSALLVALADEDAPANAWTPERVQTLISATITTRQLVQLISEEVSIIRASTALSAALAPDVLAALIALNQSLVATSFASFRGNQITTATGIAALLECNARATDCFGGSPEIPAVCADQEFPEPSLGYQTFPFASSQVLLSPADSAGGLFPGEGSTEYTVLALDLGEAVTSTAILDLYQVGGAPGAVRPVPAYYGIDNSPAFSAQGVNLLSRLPPVGSSGQLLFGTATMFLEPNEGGVLSAARYREAFIQWAAGSASYRDRETGTVAFANPFWFPSVGFDGVPPCGDEACSQTIFFVALTDDAVASLGLSRVTDIAQCFALGLDGQA